MKTFTLGVGRSGIAQSPIVIDDFLVSPDNESFKPRHDAPLRCCVRRLPKRRQTEGKCRSDESFGFGLFFLQPLCDEGPLQVRELRRDQPLVAANVCGTPAGGQGSPRSSSAPDGRHAFLVQEEKPLAPKKLGAGGPLSRQRVGTQRWVNHAVAGSKKIFPTLLNFFEA